MSQFDQRTRDGEFSTSGLERSHISLLAHDVRDNVELEKVFYSNTRKENKSSGDDYGEARGSPMAINATKHDFDTSETGVLVRLRFDYIFFLLMDQYLTFNRFAPNKRGMTGKNDFFSSVPAGCYKIDEREVRMELNWGGNWGVMQPTTDDKWAIQYFKEIGLKPICLPVLYGLVLSLGRGCVNPQSMGCVQMQNLPVNGLFRSHCAQYGKGNVLLSNSQVDEDSGEGRRRSLR